MEAPFLPPVSAGLFWCLVFAVCPGDVPNMLARRCAAMSMAWLSSEVFSVAAF
jgi:hypothetical protein